MYMNLMFGLTILTDMEVFTLEIHNFKISRHETPHDDYYENKYISEIV